MFKCLDPKLVDSALYVLQLIPDIHYSSDRLFWDLVDRSKSDGCSMRLLQWMADHCQMDLAHEGLRLLSIARDVKRVRPIFHKMTSGHMVQYWTIIGRKETPALFSQAPLRLPYHVEYRIEWDAMHVYVSYQESEPEPWSDIEILEDSPENPVVIKRVPIEDDDSEESSDETEEVPPKKAKLIESDSSNDEESSDESTRKSTERHPEESDSSSEEAPPPKKYKHRAQSDSDESEEQSDSPKSSSYNLALDSDVDILLDLHRPTMAYPDQLLVSVADTRRPDDVRQIQLRTSLIPVVMELAALE